MSTNAFHPGYSITHHSDKTGCDRHDWRDPAGALLYRSVVMPDGRRIETWYTPGPFERIVERKVTYPDGRIHETGFEADNLLQTGAGNDTVWAGAGQDTVITGNGRDFVGAGDGNDRVTTGTGNDTVFGGKGNDTIWAGNGHDLVNGGDGNDRVFGGTGNDTIWAGSGNDQVDAGGGNDLIGAGNGNDRIEAGNGNDTVFGGNGNDTIWAGQGHDRVFAGNGNDLIGAGNGNDLVGAGNGNDTVFGGNGNDTIRTGAGNDKVCAGSGHDTVDAGPGRDRVDLGWGNDLLIHRFAVDPGTGDRYDGGGGVDTLRLVLTKAQATSKTFLQDLAALQAAVDAGRDYRMKTAQMFVSHFERLDVRAPVVALDDVATTDENSVVEIDVLQNDLDLIEWNTDALRIVSVNAPGLPDGSVTIKDEKSLVFDPGANFDALNARSEIVRHLTYTIIDDQGFSASADVRLTITGRNDAPTLAAGTAAAVEDGPTVDVDLAALGADADSEDDGTSLSYTITGAPSEGSATILGTTLTFDPGADFQTLALGETRDVVIQVTATDARGESAVNDVTVTVTGRNDAPTLADAPLPMIEADETLSFDLATLANDIDSDDDASSLTYAVLSQTGGGLASVSGSVLNFDPQGAFDSLAGDEIAEVVVQVQVTDRHGASAQRELVVQIENPNAAPVFTGDPALTGLNAQVEGRLGSQFANPDQSVVAFTLVNEGVGGNVQLPDIGTIFTDPDGDGFTGYVLRDWSYVDDSGALVPIDYTKLNAAFPTWTFNMPIGRFDFSTLGGDSPSAGYYLIGFGAVDARGAESAETVWGFLSIANTVDGNGSNNVFDPLTLFDDVVPARGGNDLVNGGAGFDTIAGGDNKDTLLGGDGDDVIDGNAGADSIDGGDGNDALNGGNGQDTIYGGDGDDDINGGVGIDIVFAGAGDDVLDGGDQSATFDPFFLINNPLAVITAPYEILLGQGAFETADEIVTADLSEESDLMFGETGNDVLIGRAGRDFLSGGDGDDTIAGGNGRDTLMGDAGNDELRGDDGQDRILGGDGNDTLIGNAKDDTLIAGTGTDVLVGGDGADDFVFDLDDGLNIITDFGDGSDRLINIDYITALTGAEQIDAGDAREATLGTGTLIDLADTQIMLQGVFGIADNMSALMGLFDVP
ncbi:Ig-like domain-containing protein [Mesobacterium sp. TK19101]|uniref:Ig-like domain-containing protein n=1 Tax=Mesobacterium hydrothermale TaxID=3111907 RepID=A0ABU6HDD2_9RHOB|nr:Ig-like domain-containing protein [Mesobacterium sp. TK19101]MEC3860473.1 Ig-like domain-containing protein [Mesobacterium sp. TK19101]